jgi:hypothetical protein
MNYTRERGVSMRVAFHELYSEGGIARFYAGAQPALLQGPLSRFGDTAANAGVLEVFRSAGALKGRKVPVIVQTASASVVAALWRVLLSPIDTLKTSMQVHGSQSGVEILTLKVRQNGLGTLFHGAGAVAVATWMGHFPWFLMYNTMQQRLPEAQTTTGKMVRNAFIGFSGAVVSDVTSNSLRVLKTVRQTSPAPITYVTALRSIMRESGMKGLMFRGLSSKLIANALQSIMFTVLWRLMVDGISLKQ